MGLRGLYLFVTKILTISLFLFAHFFIATAVVAEPVYSWRDSAGRKHFGSTPPAGATNVEALKGAGISRYSSEKLIDGFRVQQETAEFQEAEIDVDTFQNDAGDVNDQLENDLPVVEHDDQNAVTACSVIVRNKSTNAISNISVAFEFSDGTFVPGIGPDSLDAESEATYSVPKNQLPLQFQAKAGEEALVKPVPEIRLRVHSAS